MFLLLFPLLGMFLFLGSILIGLNIIKLLFQALTNPLLWFSAILWGAIVFGPELWDKQIMPTPTAVIKLAPVAQSNTNFGVVTPLPKGCDVPRTIQFVGEDGKVHSDWCATHH